MLIVFGIRKMRRRLGVALMMCGHCRQPCAHSIVRLQTWFSLFFVPVLPVGTTFFTVCSLCAGATRIDKAQAQHLEEAARQQAAQPVQMTPDGPMTPYAPATALPPEGPSTASPATPPPDPSSPS